MTNILPRFALVNMRFRVSHLVIEKSPEINQILVIASSFLVSQIIG
jgi:hypothetical protein